jgi:hypothetical protein
MCSPGVPATHGTTQRIGFTGKASCARLENTVPEIAAAAKKSRLDVIIFVSKF